MTKSVWMLLGLSVLCGAMASEQPDPCARLDGVALNQCRSNQQTLRLQERLEQQLQQQQERQNQLDKQQREVQQQLESMRLQNESLRKQLERDAAAQQTRPVMTDASKNADDAKNADVKSWKADNPWFGSDYVRTDFAMRYVKQLQREHPELVGRELLDALSTKVNETFGAQR